MGAGAAAPVAFSPALPEDVIGGAPGSRAVIALTRALGPYAVFARPQLPQVTSPLILYACSELRSIVSVGEHVHVCV